MKNLLVFVNPSKRFANEDLVKIQIENSLQLGWQPEDILLATNFDYEYRGIKSVLVDDSCYYAKRKRATKLTTICHLFDRGLITDDCWFHDFDAFQLRPFGFPDLKGKDAGFVTYDPGVNLNWNSGSFFFKPTAKDIFGWMRDIMVRYRCHDEQALVILTKRNFNNINNRYERLNPTYNLCRVRKTADSYERADKPINILHFDIKDKKIYEEIKPLIPDGLMEIFKKYEENDR